MFSPLLFKQSWGAALVCVDRLPPHERWQDFNKWILCLPALSCQYGCLSLSGVHSVWFPLLFSRQTNGERAKAGSVSYGTCDLIVEQSYPPFQFSSVASPWMQSADVKGKKALQRWSHCNIYQSWYRDWIGIGQILHCINSKWTNQTFYQLVSCEIPCVKQKLSDGNWG